MAETLWLNNQDWDTSLNRLTLPLLWICLYEFMELTLSAVSTHIHFQDIVKCQFLAFLIMITIAIFFLSNQE